MNEIPSIVPIHLRWEKIKYKRRGKSYTFYFSHYYVGGKPTYHFDEIYITILQRVGMTVSVEILSHAWLVEEDWLPVAERVLWMLMKGANSACLN